MNQYISQENRSNWEYYKKKSNIDYISWDEIKVLWETLADFRLTVPEAETLLLGKTLNELKEIIP